MKKATRITYDPFTNSIGFRVSVSVDGPWRELDEHSSLLVYTTKKVLFTNCVRDIVTTINANQNSSREGLEIQFSGPQDDYRVLEATVAEVSAAGGGSGPLSARHIATIWSAEEAITRLRHSYGRIATEFEEYLPGRDRYEDDPSVGDAIARFLDVVGDAVPVCVIGNYSVGKSALLNALIGAEVLPSKVDPTTAKNVRVTACPEFVMGLELTVGGNAKRHCMFDVGEGFIVPADGTDTDARVLADEINAQIAESAPRTRLTTMRAVLDLLNQTPGDLSPESMLQHVGWNVDVELPFHNEVLSALTTRIVLFDTPGDDNATLDQADHRRALEELMRAQTSALPVIVSSRDKVSARSTSDLRVLLDSFSENFAVPSCLVVLSKCDTDSRGELAQAVPAEIRNWHGKSIILHTTPVGALGLRKGSEEWIDPSYRELSDAWNERQAGARHVCLPDHNVYPCGARGDASDLGVSAALYDTGIPSLEWEIRYYVEHCANYAKSSRGRNELLSALEVVQDALATKREALELARAEAQADRERTRQELVADLREIEVEPIGNLVANLAEHYAPDLEAYCASIRRLFEDVYDRVSPAGWGILEEQAEAEFIEDCQARLIDAVYLRPDGARDSVTRAMNERAVDFADSLSDFVDRHDRSFTRCGRELMHSSLAAQSHGPQFTTPSTALDPFRALLERARDTWFAAVRRVAGPDEARRQWIELKERAVNERLRSRTGILGQRVPGAFESVVLEKPARELHAQLVTWCEWYRAAVERQLDADNVLLSAKDAQIAALEGDVEDLTARLARLTGVHDELLDLIEPREVEIA